MSKKQRNMLIISLVMILIGSFMANYFNTGKRTVDVERICFETDRGKLSGLLYKPKDASDSSPRPTLVFAFINTKYLYNKNNNIYLPAFLNTILPTLMTVANTAI